MSSFTSGLDHEAVPKLVLTTGDLRLTSYSEALLPCCGWILAVHIAESCLRSSAVGTLG